MLLYLYWIIKHLTLTNSFYSLPDVREWPPHPWSDLHHPEFIRRHSLWIWYPSSSSKLNKTSVYVRCGLTQAFAQCWEWNPRTLPWEWVTLQKYSLIKSRKAAFLFTRQICPEVCLRDSVELSSIETMLQAIWMWLVVDLEVLSCCCWSLWDSLCVCPWPFTHSHIYILERSQHKVPEEALKVDSSLISYHLCYSGLFSMWCLQAVCYC